MAVFQYSAVDASGKTITGSIEAESENLVISRLQQQQYHIVSIRRARGGTKTAAQPRKSSTKGKKVKLQQLVVFTRQLSTMIEAGIGIVKCLEILGNQTKDPVMAQVIETAKRDVKGGMSLTEAFSKHPHVFNKLYVNMIRAAETGGILDTILERVSQFLEKEQEIRNKIKSAMMYPTIVLIFAFCMVGALFVFVLPKFKEIFASMNIEMPPATAMLFAMSDLLRNYIYIPIGFAVGGYFGIRWVLSTPGGRYQYDKLKLNLPVVGELVQKMAISRFARTFGTLIASGVPMMRSLEIVGETSGNIVIAKAVENARNSIREGQKVSAPLAASGVFPAMVTHMIDVGEETGRLSDMLVKVSDFYDDEVDNAVKGLTSMIEPCLIVFMGLVVGFIAISIMAPIFKIVTSIE